MRKLRFFLLIVFLVSLGSKGYGFTTYYYPSSATLTGVQTVCQSAVASALTCNVPTTGSLQTTGSGSNVVVTYTWYYNTTGSVTSGTPVTGYTGLTYTAGATAQVLTLPGSAINTATPGVYYYYVILSGTNTADASGSAILLTTNTQTVTVKAPPGAIAGSGSVCTGATLTLTDPVPGGSWTSGATGTASVGGATGIVTGVAAGSAPITYSNGCGSAATTTITVNGSPAAITGSATVCQGSVITLSETTTGGTWSCPATTIATVDGTGHVTGISAGIATITYTGLCGTPATHAVTVQAIPGAISGGGSLCGGAILTLTDPVAGGTWSSSASGTAAVSGSGVVTGGTSGTATITYSTGCGTPAITDITVNVTPAAILGTATVCAGSTTTLTDATAGGSWTSGSSSIASVDAAGVVSGAAQGTAVITYTTTCGSANTTVTVNDVPAAITGSTSLCILGTTTLANTMPGGTWSSSASGTAAVDPTTGIVTGGVGTGTATITYSTGCGAAVTAAVTVNGSPAAIAGTPEICAGTGTSLTDATTGGTWTSSTPTVASIDPVSGVVTGIAGGTTTISYATGCGTPATMTMTIDPLPSAITGTLSLCGGVSSSLSDAVTGGTWSSSATSVATIDAASGVATATGTGNTTIDYTTTCGSVTAVITVNALPPAPISGAGTICSGNTLTLSDATTGGSWTSGATTIATVDISGVVTGLSMGSATITYSTGCGADVYASVSVNPTPSAIGGTLSLCGGISTSLTNTAALGTWSSTATSIATIDPVSGVANALAIGETTISFTNICGTATAVLTVSSVAPGSISGVGLLCAGGSLTLSDTPTGGTWSSSDGSVATVDAGGVVAGVAAGTATIDYATGCGTPASALITVSPLPAAITVPGSICTGGTTTVTDAVSGGTWSSAGTIATVDASTGVATGVSGGVETITYTTACGSVTAPLTVFTAPSSIGGATTVCAGSTITLTDLVSGGTWTSSVSSIASVDAVSGVVTGNTFGVATISYSSGCGTDAIVSISVNTAPSAIAGPSSVCTGSTITLSSTGTGTWSVGSASLASIGSASGILTGSAAGIESVTYSTGCGTDAYTNVTVNAAPAAITGSTSLCSGSNTTLADAVPGGTWSTTTGSITTVDAASGDVTGISVGTGNIVYSTGCGTDATFSISINNSPDPIGGATSVCETATATLIEATGGGTWSSSSTSNATIDPATGIITGISAGSTVISYVTACGTSTLNVVVNPATAPIVGGLSLCVSGSTSLTDATTGGTWASGAISVATVDATGLVSGIATGTAVITYNSSVCGATTTVVTVTGAPGSVSGLSVVCGGNTITLSDATSGGGWSSSDVTTASVDPSTGVVTGVAAGTVNISYTTSCGTSSAAVTVNGAPSAVSGPDNVCNGFGVTLSCAPSGGTWSSADPGTATVDASGVVTGHACASTVITYSVGCGVSVYPFTVNCAPSVISATASTMCELATITVSDPVSGGTWSNSNGNVSVDAVTGVVTGVSTGNDTIVYTTGCGFPAYYPVQVFAAPAPISGTDTLCVNASTVLSDPAAGGTWSSSDLTLASVGSLSGVVTGAAAGTVYITYTTGCGTPAVYIMTVDPLPSPITGLSSLCQFSAITLSDGGTGVWTTSNTTVATIDPLSGVITASGNGVDTVYFTLLAGRCSVSKVVTVNPFPNAGIISGSSIICIGDSTLFTDGAIGGVWMTSDPTVAVVSASGYVTGVATGITTINFSVTNGCGTATSHKVVTVNSFPSAGVVTGGGPLCVGSTSTLFPSVTGGSWSGSAPAVASVVGGTVTALSAGTDTVHYTVTGACGSAVASAIVVVLDSAAAITGSGFVCVLATGTLNDAAVGGTWTSSDLGTATISGSTGIVTGVGAGLVTISYSTGCGSTETTTLTVNALADAGTISGPVTFCTGTSVTLADTASGGTWGYSGTGITLSGPVVTGISAGLDTVFYSVTNSCNSSIAIWPVTVNAMPIPGVLFGPDTVCAAATIDLVPTQPGGVWSVTNGNASVVSGTVTGNTAGTDSVVYTVSSAFCGSASTAILVTVLPQPSAGVISGGSSVCVGLTLFLSETVPGGVWSSSAASVATVSAGIVGGVAQGLAAISYTVSNSCGSATTSQIVSVNPNAVAGTILGVDTLCYAAAVEFSDASPGGVWSSSDTALAIVGPTSGIVTGMAGGLDTIYYTVTNACNTAVASRPVFVLTAPSAGTITGSSSLCAASSTTLSSTVSGGIWSTTSTNVMLTGDVVGGVSAGTAIITYSVSNACGTGTGTFAISVDEPANAVVSGYSWVCMGIRNHVDSLTGTPSGGTWSTSVSLDTISAAGVLTGGAPGTTTVTYTFTNGCGTSVGTINVLVYSKADCDSILDVRNVNQIAGQLTIYPNPSTGLFTVLLPSRTQNAVVMITDIYGKEVLRKEVEGNLADQAEFDLTHYPANTYLVRVLADGVTYSTRLLILNR